ncbi:MAG: AAA family ATPase, partial [Methylococcales bacterium]
AMSSNTNLTETNRGMFDNGGYLPAITGDIESSQPQHGDQYIKQAPADSKQQLWANIPAEMRERKQWCVAGADKRPLTPSYKPASSTDPATWSDFDSVCKAAAAKGLHIGYVLTKDDPFTCIDLDVKDNTPDEHIEQFDKIIDASDSYTERSQGDKGYHIWLRGKIGKGKKRDGVEIYSQERFIVFTGNVIKNKAIAQGQSLLNRLVAKMPSNNNEQISLKDDSSPNWGLASRATEDSGELGMLFSGDWKGRYPSQSEADLALVKLLLPQCDSPSQCWQTFRLSALGKRDKAARPDYAKRTLEEANQHLINDAKQIQHGKEMAFNLLANAFLKKSYSSTRTSKALDKLRLISEDEIANRPPMRWRINGILPQEGFAAIYGAPGSGKSFLVLDMLGAIASGKSWFGYTVRPCPVVYLTLEGKAGTSQRVKAYRDFKGGSCGISFIEYPINLLESSDCENIVTLIKDAGVDDGVLCIDTLAASAPSIDENSSKDMGNLINHIIAIQEKLGGCVLIVHHTGKDQTRGLRGWSGLNGALDTAIEVSDNDGSRAWKVTKNKDGISGRAANFALKGVVYGRDEDGNEISSCIVDSLSDNANDEELTTCLLGLIYEYYKRGDYISPIFNAKNRAFNMLNDDVNYPKGLTSKKLNSLLMNAERSSLIEREEYRNSSSNKAFRWRVV